MGLDKIRMYGKVINISSLNRREVSSSESAFLLITRMKPLKVTENWVQVFWKTNKIQTDLEELEKLDGNNKMKCNRDKFKILHLRSKTQMKRDKKQAMA